MGSYLSNYTKKTVIVALFLVAIVALAFYYRDTISDIVVRLESIYLPCRQPIEYRIGALDNRFGITETEFLEAISSAEKIWEDHLNNDLFRYSSSGKMTVNLIYDYRQEITDKLEKMGIRVENDRASYEKLKTKYEDLISDYEQQRQWLGLRVKSFNDRRKKYEADVAYWNRRGGAPKDEYDHLSSEQQALNIEANAINAQQEKLNILVDNINAIAETLNRLVALLNIKVAQFNEIGRESSGEFEEGVYQFGPDGQKIDIYQFNDRNQLVRVLAHELGHALGIDHLEDPEAIMYRLNTSNNLYLTEDDILALKKKCNIRKVSYEH